VEMLPVPFNQVERRGDVGRGLQPKQIRTVEQACKYVGLRAAEMTTSAICLAAVNSMDAVMAIALRVRLQYANWLLRKGYMQGRSMSKWRPGLFRRLLRIS